MTSTLVPLINVNRKHTTFLYKKRTAQSQQIILQAIESPKTSIHSVYLWLKYSVDMSVIIEQIPDRKKVSLTRRDSKDSCFSEAELSEDLSVTGIDECNRLSPMATLSPISRKSSGGDSAIDCDVSDGELSRVSVVGDLSFLLPSIVAYYNLIVVTYLR